MIDAILARLPGIKHRELKPCALCGKPPAHDNHPLFWRLKIERFCVDVDAVVRQHALEQMIGSPAIANAMGPDSDVAKVIDGPFDILVCEPCTLEKLRGVFMVAEQGSGS